MMKKTYVPAKAEIVRVDAKDIITLSGFFGQEVSFKTKRSTAQDATINWND